VTRRILAAGLLAAVVAVPAAAENWPQWRGPKNDGHSAETGLPAEFGPDKNVIWKLKMPGPGESTPCVWGDRMFFTSYVGPEQVVLMCVGTDGKEKWRKPLIKSDVEREKKNPDSATNASASCSTDGKHVWSYAGGRQTGLLTCHTVDGTPVWEKDIPKTYGAFGIQFGTHWTPCLHDGRLYLMVMHKNAQKLVCLTAATGAEVWQVVREGADMPGAKNRTESSDVYSSPVIWEGQGGPLLIVHGNDYCTAHKLDTGAEVWRVGGLNPTGSRAWRFISGPVVSPDLIVIPSCKTGPTVGINPVGAKGTIEDKPFELWKLSPREKVITPDVPSPLRVGDVVYIVEAGGPMTAIEAKTGTVLYTSQPTTKGKHRANPVYADGKIYAVGVEGGTTVVKPGPKFEALSRNQLPDRFLASPAVSGGRLYLRGYDHLWAIGTK
jgi:outer membrane protein assembly factor BamB